MQRIKDYPIDLARRMCYQIDDLLTEFKEKYELCACPEYNLYFLSVRIHKCEIITLNKPLWKKNPYQLSEK